MPFVHNELYFVSSFCLFHHSLFCSVLIRYFIYTEPKAKTFGLLPSCQHCCDIVVLKAWVWTAQLKHTANIPLHSLVCVRGDCWYDTLVFSVWFDDSERVLRWEEEADLPLRLVWASAAVKLINAGAPAGKLGSQTTSEPHTEPTDHLNTSIINKHDMIYNNILIWANEGNVLKKSNYYKPQFTCQVAHS